MKQTAVELFTQELDKRYCVILNYSEYQKLIKQAQEMEKEQIIDFAENWSKEILRIDRNINIEQYYQETFKSE